MVGFSGQSLPILAPLLTIDVLWSDLHMVHEGRSLIATIPFIAVPRQNVVHPQNE
jgi:hypothetical protein